MAVTVLMIRRRLQGLVKCYGTRLAGGAAGAAPPAQGGAGEDSEGGADRPERAGGASASGGTPARTWDAGLYDDAKEAEGDAEDAWLDLPAVNLYFDGARLTPYDLDACTCVQGRSVLQVQPEA